MVNVGENVTLVMDRGCGHYLFPFKLLKHNKELNPFKHETLYAPLQRLESRNF